MILLKLGTSLPGKQINISENINFTKIVWPKYTNTKNVNNKSSFSGYYYIR